MVRIGFPMRRLAAAGDNHASTVFGTTGPGRDGGGQVHGERHRADDAVGMMDEPNEGPSVGLADHVDDPVQRRVPVPGFAALDELNSATEVIDNGLV